MTVERLPEACHDEAVAFLTGVFSCSAGAPFLNRELRHWKYYAPHPFSKEPRCCVFRDAEGLIAHGGLSPLEYCTPDGIKTSFQVIDWAGASRRAGSGFMLFRALWGTADSYLGIGGSGDAQKVMRRIPTVRTAGAMEYFAYPLRPWGQLTAGPLSWRSPFKWMRAWKWRLARKRPPLDAWTAVPVDALTESDSPLLVPASRGLYTPLRRTPALVNYWLACPAGRVRAWRLVYEGKPVGILVIAFLRQEARIVDLIVNNPAPPLAEAFSLAIDLASKDRGVYELSAATTAHPAIEAMTAAGMVRRGAAEVFLGDPRHNFSTTIPIEVNLTIGDGFYQQGEQPYFHTF